MVTALLVNFVIVPVAAIILTQVIPLEDALVTGLILVSLAAGAPGLPKTAEIAKLGTAAATGLTVLMVVLNFQNVIDVLGSGGLPASVILVIVSAVGGYLLGSLGRSEKWVQALGAGQRNIAAAMVVATMNFGNDEIVMVVVYSLITLVVVTPLALELGKRQATAEEAESEPDTVPETG